MKKSSGRRLCA